MASAIHRKIKVLPGGKIEFVDPELPSGQDVDVFVVVAKPKSDQRLSALEIIRQASGHRVFQSSDDVDDYVRRERDQWESSVCRGRATST